MQNNKVKEIKLKNKKYSIKMTIEQNQKNINFQGNSVLILLFSLNMQKQIQAKISSIQYPTKGRKFNAIQLNSITLAFN